jgi:hypothetical protein
MRESEALVDFYRAVREDKRRKLYIGPMGNLSVASDALGCRFMQVPMQNLARYTEPLTEDLLASDFDVLLFGAGMAGNIPVVKCWEKYPERTYISLGSALDPLGRGPSRKQQISPERARAMFAKIERTAHV